MQYLVFGPPGTGKTRFLSESAAEKIALDRDAADQIVACSFSVAAAETLRDRMGINEMRAGTLHSFGYQQLDKAGGIKVIDAPERKGQPNALLREWNDTYPLWKISGQHRENTDELLGAGSSGVDAGEDGFKGDAFLNGINYARQSMLEGDAFFVAAANVGRVPKELVKQFWPEWLRFKARTGGIDFTDMIEIPYVENWDTPLGADIVYIDEAQDCTPLMVARIAQFNEHVGEYGEIYFGLDDDQTIYSHLGCTPKPILALDAERIYLRQSWRIPASVHRVSQKWIHLIDPSNREEKEFTPTEREGSAESALLSLARDGNAPEKLARAVESDIASGKTVMLLASTNLYAAQICATLREAGLPFANQYRPKNGFWNPLGSQSQQTGALATLIAWNKPQIGIPWTHRDILRIAKFIKTRGVFKNATSMVTEIEKMSPQLMDSVAAQVTLERWFEDSTAQMEMASGNLDWLRSRLPLQGKKMKGELHLNIYEKRGINALTEKPKITVGTIHSVKGGEADKVYLFPDISRAAYDAATKSIDNRDALRRAFYVGMTRAKEELVLCQKIGADNPRSLQRAVNWRVLFR